MGFRVHLIAITGKPVVEIHTDLGVSPSGKHEEIAESPIVGSELKNGAYIVYLNDEIIPEPEFLCKLSQRATAVSCYVNETVMNSLTSCWVDGVEQWSVFHNAQNAIDDLQVNGTPPDEFEAIRQRLAAKQDGCTDTDYIFDIPVDLFVAAGGMRYDEDPQTINETDEPWEVLIRG